MKPTLLLGFLGVALLAVWILVELQHEAPTVADVSPRPSTQEPQPIVPEPSTPAPTSADPKPISSGRTTFVAAPVEHPLADPRFAGKTRSEWRREITERIDKLTEQRGAARAILGDVDSDGPWSTERGEANMQVRDLDLRIKRDQELLRDLEAAR